MAQRKMIGLEHTVVIERPMEEVFDFINDPANDVKWQGSTVESRQTSEGPYGVGTTVRQVSRFLGLRLVTTYEITEYNRPTRSFFRGASGPFSFLGGSQLELTNEGTKLTGTGEVGARGLFKLVLPIVAASARRDLVASFARLKALLDAPMS